MRQPILPTAALLCLVGASAEVAHDLDAKHSEMTHYRARHHAESE